MATEADLKKLAEDTEALFRKMEQREEYYKTPEGKKRKAEIEAALKPLRNFLNSLPVDE